MDLQWAHTQLTANATTITHLFENVSVEQARVKPDPQSWSMLEVINHLYDEEREDFRARLDFLLHRSDNAWPPTDPAGWVTARVYQQRDLHQSIANFNAERQQSLQWLQSLESPDWTQSRRHPSGFVLQAGDLLASWVAHDLLHIRQLIELRYHLTTQEAEPYSLLYAGDW